MLLGAGLMGRIRVPPFRLLMLLGLIHMALSHWRHDQLLGLLGASFACGNGRTPAPPSEIGGAWQPPRAPWPAAMALLAGLAVSVRLAVPLEHAPGAGVLAVLDAVPAELRARPVLNDYGFGADLIAHGDRPFIDSRADLYGGAFLGRFRDIAELKPDALAAALRDFRVAWTIFPPDAPVVSSLDRQPGWRRLITGPDAVVHIKDAEMP